MESSVAPRMAAFEAKLAKAREIDVISTELDDYLASIKSMSIEGLKDPTDYEVMDKPDYLILVFFRLLVGLLILM